MFSRKSDTPQSLENLGHSKIELRFSLQDLPKMDRLSQSDAQIFLLAENPRGPRGVWHQTPYKTEYVDNNANPKFITPFVLDFFFEELQRFKFVVVDVDDRQNPSWEAQDYIGEFICDLGSIVSSPGGMTKGRLTSAKKPHSKRGYIIITAEEVTTSKRNIRLQFQAKDVYKKWSLFSSKPDVYFVISRATEDNIFVPVYQSPRITSSKPCWPEFTIAESVLCSSDVDKTLKFQIMQHRHNGNHLLLSETMFSLRDLDQKPCPQIYNLHPHAPSSPSAATLQVIKFEIDCPAVFLDYIAGGMEINLQVAIDFTSSNSDPRPEFDLHNIRSSEENEYERAIRSVGSILECYDHDRMIPVYGFGGMFFGSPKVSHSFPLTKNPSKPEVNGVEGILSTYRNAIRHVVLYGPTNFSTVIRQTEKAVKADQSQGKNTYHILLIITDGIISDMDATISAIIDASKLPMSIIIVGVGSTNFENMRTLDADDQDLSRDGITMERDIVQFVEMRRFTSNTGSYDLAKAVLEEIPDQIMGYMRSKGIKPAKPKKVQIQDLLEFPYGNEYPDESPPAYSIESDVTNQTL